MTKDKRLSAIRRVVNPLLQPSASNGWLSGAAVSANDDLVCTLDNGRRDLFPPPPLRALHPFLELPMFARKTGICIGTTTVFLAFTFTASRKGLLKSLFANQTI